MLGMIIGVMVQLLGVFAQILQSLLPYLPQILMWSLIAAFLPFLFLCLPLAYLVKQEHKNYGFKKHINLLKKFNQKAWITLSVLLFCSVGIFYCSYNAMGKLGDVIGGNSILFSVFFFISWVTAAYGLFLLFDLINKGKIMNNIFDLVDDKSAMNDFLSGNSKPVVLDIKPERDIPLIKKQVIGQDHIVTDCVEHIARMARRDVRKKPLGVFLFVGSSGAGKTELAKAIAKVCFEGRMSEHFMNQMKAESDINQLFGPPPGYIGSEKGGKLTQDVKKLRSCVILLDEIEKCHKSIFDAIMTLLDEGKMTDASSGEIIDATNCVIVMTSNAEQKEIGKIVQEITDVDDQSRAIKDKLQSFFKPEQLARMSIIAPFKPLSREDLVQIIGKFLFKLSAENKVNLVGLSNQLLEQLITRHEKNSDYGIRNLITLIERDIEDGMADARENGFENVRINMRETGKLEKSGEPEKKPHVVGVPDEVDVQQQPYLQSTTRQQINNEMKG